MSYEYIGILAALVLIITNMDIIFKRRTTFQIPGQKSYRNFLVGILVFYIIDSTWGILANFDLVSWMYALTVLYFAAMGLVVFFWTKFAIEYLEENNVFGKILLHMGRIFAIAQVIAIIVNFFEPILFWYDKSGNYEWGAFRLASLIAQIAMLVLTSLYALFISFKSRDAVRRRHMTIGAFGLIMAAVLFIQLFFPLVPLYSIGLMLGSCLLHTFVIEDEKEESRGKLEEALSRENE